MTISVPQATTFNGASSGSFGSNVTAGNSIVLVMFSYTNSGATISTSAPLFNGSSVTGASKLMEIESPGGGGDVYGAAWLLPNLAGGAKSVALTVTNGIVDANVGMAAYEISGLGSSPALDTTTPNPETGTNVSTNPVSGSTGNLASSPDILIGMAVEYGVAVTGPASAWTNQSPSSLCVAGYQIVTSSGSAFAYNCTSGSAGAWIAGIAAIAASGGAAASATPAPLVVPSLAAIQAATW